MTIYLPLDFLEMDIFGSVPVSTRAMYHQTTESIPTPSNTCEQISMTLVNGGGHPKLHGFDTTVGTAFVWVRASVHLHQKDQMFEVRSTGEYLPIEWSPISSSDTNNVLKGVKTNHSTATNRKEKRLSLCFRLAYIQLCFEKLSLRLCRRWRRNKRFRCTQWRPRTPGRSIWSARKEQVGRIKVYPSIDV
jgi:hypothetical protein